MPVFCYIQQRCCAYIPASLFNHVSHRVINLEYSSILASHIFCSRKSAEISPTGDVNLGRWLRTPLAWCRVCVRVRAAMRWFPFKENDGFRDDERRRFFLRRLTSRYYLHQAQAHSRTDTRFVFLCHILALVQHASAAATCCCWLAELVWAHGLLLFSRPYDG